MRNINYKQREILEVEWDDIITTHGWKSYKQLKRTTSAPCRSVGYFVEQTKNCLTIATGVGDGDDEGMDAHTIPKGCIKRVCRLSGRKK